MANVDSYKPLPSLPAPASVAPGFLKGLLKTYFGTPLNAVLTILAVGLLYLILPPLVSWAVITASALPLPVVSRPSPFSTAL